MRFGVRLDCSADVAQPRARTHYADTAPHAFIGDVHQPPGLDARLADVIHAARVAMKAVLDHGNVDIEDVAGLQDALARHAVAHLVIDRGADGLRERLV